MSANWPSDAAAQLTADANEFVIRLSMKLSPGGMLLRVASA